MTNDSLIDEFTDYIHTGFDDDIIIESQLNDSDISVKPQVESLNSLILQTLRKVLAKVNNSSPEDALALIQRIKTSKDCLKSLEYSYSKLYEAVFEVLEHECTTRENSNIDFSDILVLTVYKQPVREEIAAIAHTDCSDISDPHATWFSLTEIVQRSKTKKAALDLASAIDTGDPLNTLMSKYKKVEPPTTQKSVFRAGRVRSASELITDLRVENAGKPAYRFSSGLPTLDLGYTGQDEEKGFIAPGQFIVVMGPTGTGKTSFSNTVTPAFGVDMLNWGLKDAYQVMFHTEEESIDKIKGFRMDVGQKFHNLATNLVIDAIGTSRKRMAETLYDLVIAADEKSRSLKRPITDFLPYIVQLDYIQSIQESNEDEKEATAKTAEFLLRGVAAWNPEEMHKFSGVDFRSYAGMSWPSGMEQHRVAVVGYAQLVKVSDDTLYFKPDKRNIQISDFALLDDKDEPLWEVRENDLRLFGKNQMRGSGIIAQNAHAIVILHRSVPYNNPARKGDDGRMHLVDTRARILFDKSRAGSRLPYAPMRFDVQSTGFRAQYMDEIAERALQAGKLHNIDSCYTESGDPMVPVRPKIDKLSIVKY